MDQKVLNYINEKYEEIVNIIKSDKNIDYKQDQINNYINTVCNMLGIEAVVKKTNNQFSPLENNFSHLAGLNGIDKSDLMNNTEPRCPVVLIIDTSKSMGKSELYEGSNPISEVNKGIKILFNFIKNDFTCKKRCEISVISLNEKAEIKRNFSLLQNNEKDIEFVAKGQTNFGPALETMMKIIAERKKIYDLQGIRGYRPIVILLTDGGPGDIKKFNLMKEMIFNATKKKELTFHAIKVGKEKDLSEHKKHFEMLQGFDCNIPASLLDVDKIKDFFIWLSRSVQQRSKQNNLGSDSFIDSSSWRKDSI